MPYVQKEARTPLSESLSTHWDESGNALPISMLSNGSSRPTRWRCDLGHSTLKAPAAFKGGEFTCAVCLDRELLVGFNDLLTRCPKIAEFFDEDLNAISASEVLWVGTTKYWWKCVNGHSIHQSMSDRTKKGYGCSKCPRGLVAGQTDLGTMNSEVAAEWHPTKNGEVTPQQITANSHFMAWWKCTAHGHEWPATVASRTHQWKNSCPICSNHKVLVGFNDLNTTDPDISSQIHSAKSDGITGKEVTAGSSKKLVWQCSVGGEDHDWQASVASRVNGSSCNKCSYRARGDKLQRPEKGKSLRDLMPRTAAEWHPTKNGDKRPEDYGIGSMEEAWWKCLAAGHEWKTRICYRTSGESGCRRCRASGGEQEVVAFLEGVGVKPDTSVRDLITPYEVDIYLPEQKLAIEYNGMWWHSEKVRKDPSYHKRKWEAAKSAGVQLIQIWEEDWKQRTQIVQALLLRKLGLDDSARIFARKTQVEKISKAEAQSILDAHHIQGYASGSTYLGLRSITGELVAAMVLRKQAHEVNIIRYVTAHSVPGGFTKLLKAAQAIYPEYPFITFSDHMVSDGGLYAASGFVAEKGLAPDYAYIVNGVRQHKFGYRLKRFRTDPSLLWEKGKTERELADLNNLTRIWDAGKTRWIKVASTETQGAK